MDTGDYCRNQSQVAQEQVPVPTLPTSKDALDYNMCHPNRGICLILETENFSQKHAATRGLPKRIGSSVDSKHLHQLFHSLDFQVYVEKDLTLASLRVLLKGVAAADHSQSDCFVCIVLTHGDHGFLYAHDERYAIEHLFMPFLGNNCPTLVGRPKLFFIQACQGNRVDPGVLAYADASDSAGYLKIPTYADFMIAYSSLPGFYSFRNTERGCWFIRALVQTLEEYHMHYDLLTIMTIVSQRVAYDYSSQTADPAMSHMKQVPCITSMLTRRVFLFPKTVKL